MKIIIEDTKYLEDLILQAWSLWKAALSLDLSYRTLNNILKKKTISKWTILNKIEKMYILEKEYDPYKNEIKVKIIDYK